MDKEEAKQEVLAALEGNSCNEKEIEKNYSIYYMVYNLKNVLKVCFQYYFTQKYDRVRFVYSVLESKTQGDNCSGWVGGEVVVYLPFLSECSCCVFLYFVTEKLCMLTQNCCC